MKNSLKIFLCAYLFFIFYSCKSDNNSCNSCSQDFNNVTKDSLKYDKSTSLKQAINSEKIVKKSQEQMENLKKIEKKFGEQWDFCSCVLANDSINKAFSKKISDQQAEKLMTRWEYVEIKCKEFLTQPNTTPEERLIHEKKVKKCLRSRK